MYATHPPAQETFSLTAQGPCLPTLPAPESPVWAPSPNSRDVSRPADTLRVPACNGFRAVDLRQFKGTALQRRWLCEHRNVHGQSREMRRDRKIDRVQGDPGYRQPKLPREFRCASGCADNATVRSRLMGNVSLDFQTVDALVDHVSVFVRALWYAAIALIVFLGIFVSRIVLDSDADEGKWRTNRNLFVITIASSALSIIGGGLVMANAIDMIVQAGVGENEKAYDSYSKYVSTLAFGQGLFLSVSFVCSTILVTRNFRSIAKLGFELK